jgi:hypothetical protein
MAAMSCWTHLTPHPFLLHISPSRPKLHPLAFYSSWPTFSSVQTPLDVEAGTPDNLTRGFVPVGKLANLGKENDDVAVAVKAKRLGGFSRKSVYCGGDE